MSENKIQLKLPISTIGISTAENISLYHYLSGGTLLRLVLPSENKSLECKDYEICQIYNPNLYTLKELHLIDIEKLVRTWNADGIIFEGFGAQEIINNEFIDTLREKLNLPIGVRIFEPANIYKADFIVYDHFIEYNNLKTINFLKNYEASYPWLELQLYYREPLIEKFFPFAKIAGEKEIPIHIYLLDNKGGGPVKELYKEIRELNPYVYIHVNLYGEYITYCSNCNKPVAYREDGVLLTLELNNSRCWNCNKELPFKKIISKRSNQKLIKISGGDTLWYDPRAIQIY
ncbi:MAG: hypothetical protein RXQ93_05295 [Caldisphaera sp.]|jgi:hypothetical protein